MIIQDKPLHSIIFVSSVTEIISTEEVKYIVDAERKQAHSNGLSGLVLVLGGNVLRLIEGKKEDVYDEFDKVKRNINLTNVIKLFDSPLEYRYFEKYVFMSDIHSALNDYNREEMDAYLEECFKIDSQEMRIVKDFIRNNK